MLPGRILEKACSPRQAALDVIRQSSSLVKSSQCQAHTHAVAHNYLLAHQEQLSFIV